MRRILMAVAVFAGLSAFAGATGPATAQDGVDFTVHAASCPIDHVGGFYETCHDNFLEGSVLTLTADGMAPVEIISGSDGVGEGLILSGMESAANAVLTTPSVTGGWIYCKDQISGFVLTDGPFTETGAAALGSISATQWIICDVYYYDAVVEAANG